MARAVTRQRKAVNTALAWAIGLLIFFPILWTILTSFKTEAQAISDPPVFLFFDWTLENYRVVQERSDYMRFLWNSVIIAGGSTVLGLIIAVPAAWSMAFVPSTSVDGSAQAASTRLAASDSPRKSSIIAPDRMAALGLAMPCPAMSGAEPCTRHGATQVGENVPEQVVGNDDVVLLG